MLNRTDLMKYMGAAVAGLSALVLASLMASAAAADELPSMASLCGTKPLTVALARGFNGNSWHRISGAEFEDEISQCKNIKEVLYTDGQNNPQKAISDIQGLVAQGVNAIVVFPDAGRALLPTIRQAYKAGVSIVTYISSPGGQAGKDYVAAVLPDNNASGEAWARWMAKQLHGKGLVAFLGGTPGSTTDQALYETVKKVFAETPDLKLLEGIQITNYSAADAQKVTAGLLAQRPDIAGVINTYGGSAIGSVRAFVAAGRPLVPIVSTDVNELGCAYQEYKPTNPGFALLTVGSSTWQSRAAIRIAVAHAEGLVDKEPTVQRPAIGEDSTKADLQPKCDRSLPLDIPLSAHLSRDQLKTLFAKQN
jgi:ribose transport system substrate-binding protein